MNRKPSNEGVYFTRTRHMIFITLILECHLHHTLKDDTGYIVCCNNGRTSVISSRTAQIVILIFFRLNSRDKQERWRWIIFFRNKSLDTQLVS